MRISDWSPDVCSSDLHRAPHRRGRARDPRQGLWPHDEDPHRQPRQAARDGQAAARVRDHRRSTDRRDHGKPRPAAADGLEPGRSEEHTSELQSLMRISYAVFCLIKKNMNMSYTYISCDIQYN